MPVHPHTCDATSTCPLCLRILPKSSHLSTPPLLLPPQGRGIEADPEGAFHDFQQGAAQGDPYALFNLGYMFLKVGAGPMQYSFIFRFFSPCSWMRGKAGRGWQGWAAKNPRI